MSVRKHPLYSTWLGMVSRCHNPRHTGFALYGGRGIVVCSAWRQSVYPFAEHMGDKPEGMTLDRIDNSGNYEPGNVRWATRLEQQVNSSNPPVWLTHNGITKQLSEWARDRGMSNQVLSVRLKRGWTMEEALSIPLRERSTVMTYRAQRGLRP